MNTDTPSDFKSGYVALIGRPNAGKSTLVNRLLGQKLSIVTRKAQTTRQRVLGIASQPGYQAIFLDTPGVIKPTYGLQDRMMKSVRRAVADADVLVFVADVATAKTDTRSLSLVKDKPCILVLNKIDLIKQEDALPLVASYAELHPFAEVIPASAKTGYQVDLVMQKIVELLPRGPRLYPDDVISDQPERFFVAELIREQLFERIHQEVPYHCQVDVVRFEEREDEKDIIDAEIIVDRDTQKGIVIGKGGNNLKHIGTKARAQIEEFLGRDVFLRLYVKVRPGWRDSDSHLRAFGYDKD